MGSGKILRASIRKYGVDNFKKEILEFIETRELLIEAEKKYITSEMIIDKDCMNIMSGGTGGFISIEQQRHRSECGGKAFANKLKNDENFKKEHSFVASKNLMSGLLNGNYKRCDWTNKKHSDETKKLISDKAKERIGDKNSQYGTCWITKNGLNKKIKKDELDKYQLEGWVKGRK